VDSPALELINSEWWYGRGPAGIEDQLLVPGWVESFAGRWDFAAAGVPNSRERVELIELRALLRRLVNAIAADERLRQRDLDELDRIIGAAALRRHVTLERNELAVELVPERHDWLWVRSEIAASFAELVEQGEWERIKLCANGECRWAFYDESKNRRRRWCGAASCGDLDKVRRFRERQRAAGAGQTARPRSSSRPATASSTASARSRRSSR
jgi:predicted RNA-binding Zn ribbon-like protein